MFQTVITFLKAASQYLINSLVRKTTKIVGVKSFVKGVVKNKASTKKLFANLVKKNVLKKLGPVNYVRRLAEFGAKETAKRFAVNRFVPWEFRKIGYFCKLMKDSMKKEKVYDYAAKWIFNEGTKGNSIFITNNAILMGGKTSINVNVIDCLQKISRAKCKTREQREMKERLLSKTLYFRVKSPETHNFSQQYHRYHPKLHIYDVPIRSRAGSYTRRYLYYFTSLRTIKKAVATSNYGREVFNNCIRIR